MKSVTVQSGVTPSDYEVLVQLAKLDPDAAGSVRDYTGRILRQHARENAPRVQPQQQSRQHVAAGK